MNTTGETLLIAAQNATSQVPMAQLAPANLEAAAEEALRAFRIAATPSNTWTAYAKALRYICAWAQARFGAPLPLPTPPAMATQFVVDHFGLPERDGAGRLSMRLAMPEAVDRAMVDAGFKTKLGRQKISTIDQRLAILSWAHQEKRLTSPTEDPGVRRLMKDCRKLARELGEGPKSKAAATQEPLDAMLATCDDTLEGIRDRALLLFGWASGGRRRSEIAEAQVEDFEWLGEAQAIFSMRRSKTSDGGPKPVVDDAAAALRVWLTRSGITTGPIFRRIWHGTRLGGDGLSPHAIAEIIKRRADRAGLPGDFSGHSLRRGFITEAGASDVSLAEGMALSGHRTPKSYVRYSETGNLLAGKAARLRSRKSVDPSDNG